MTNSLEQEIHRLGNALRIKAGLPTIAGGALPSAEFLLSKISDVVEAWNLVEESEVLGRSMAVTIAANDAPALIKERADYTCDGVADDVQIQAALDSYQKVILSEGTFTIAATLRLKSGSILEGSGRSGYNVDTGTIISAVDDLDDNLIELDAVSVTHFQIKNLGFAGNKANQASGHGIYIDWTGTALTSAPRCLIENVIVNGCKDNGIYIIQPNTMNGGAVTLSDVFARQNDGIGFRLEGEDIFANNCAAQSNGLQGWRIDGNALQISQCKAGGNGTITEASGDGFYIESPRVYMVGCFAQFNENYGFNLAPSGETNDTLLVGCVAQENGDNDIVGYGFNVNRNNVMLVGCMGHDTTSDADKAQDYGFHIAATRNNIWLVGCYGRGNITAAVHNESAATNIHIQNMEGWKTANSGTGTIASGATTAVVTHGLAVTPSLQDISIVFGEQADADYGRWWISNITSTQFTLNVTVNPGASGLDFGWRAEVI